MRLGFLLVTGIFFNIFMAVIFPFQLLDTQTAIGLMGSDTIGYDFSDNPYLSEDFTKYYNDYDASVDKDKLDTISEQQSSSTVLSTIGNFFDGLTDALSKIKSALAFIIPFSTIFFLLPGALGLILGYLYTGVFVYAVVRFIRGA